ncbi:MAG TPA: hypothetical protein H9740_02005 [Candidatus Hungatella pullicola]|nr:hypothetical protein [Candidatus Hungatella pullicola]
MTLSFENGIPEFLETERCSVKINSRVHRDGQYSLMVQSDQEGTLWINGKVGAQEKDGKEGYLDKDNFVCWIHLNRPLSRALKFSFYKDQQECCSFLFQTSFTGWRTCWVPFEDMEGKPVRGMNRIGVHMGENSEFCMDQLITSVPIDPRHSTRDYQVPFVNLQADGAANAHWLALVHFSELLKEGLASFSRPVTFQERLDGQLAEERFEQVALRHSTWGKWTVDQLCEQAKGCRCREIEGKLSERAVEVIHQRAAYPREEAQHLIALTDAVNIKDYGECLLNIAYAWHGAGEEDRPILEECYLKGIRHLFHQGWAFGSSMGTTHHLGYNVKELFLSVFLMRQPLKNAGLKEDCARMAGWYCGLGRIFRKEEKELEAESADTLNTLLQGIFTAALLTEKETDRIAFLYGISRWLGACLKPSPGLEGPFKEDGSAFHHCNHYPAYAMGGFISASPVVWALSRTVFALPAKAHETMRKCLLYMRIYSNHFSWLISMSSRHPVGIGEMSQISDLEPFYYMAKAGTPDQKKETDGEMAGALLRLCRYEEFPGAEEFRQAGFSAEPAPEGHFSMNYACAGIQRRGEWLAGVRGHSRYLWGSEIYEKNNLYGRYITYGNLQILSGGHPINHTDSGFYQEGWDWNCWPGTTAPAIDLERLRAKVKVVDQSAGFEEMLISDERFAGGVAFEGRNGAFAMKLHGHSKYDGSFRARKSWFFFDNRIICLGTGIEDEDSAADVRTTLFQHYLKEEGMYVEIGGKKVEYGPQGDEMRTLMESDRTENDLWLKDPAGNAYRIAEGQKLHITMGLQRSRSQNLGEPTSAPFVKAWLSHGSCPQGEEYEYMIEIQPKEEVLAMEKSYEVLQKDQRAHVVKDRLDGTIGYAFFESTQTDFVHEKGYILGCDTPCMVMERNNGNGLTVSVSDPDLRLYEGVDRDQLNPDGSQREVSLYSRPWRGRRSIGKELKLYLKGSWSLLKEEEGISVDYDEKITIITVFCIDGKSIEFRLI